MEAANSFAAALLRSTNLQMLELSGNPLQTDGIIAILRELCNTSSLTTLDISSTSSERNEVADAVKKDLPCNSQIQQLCLSDLPTAGASLYWERSSRRHFNCFISKYQLTSAMTRI